MLGQQLAGGSVVNAIAGGGPGGTRHREAEDKLARHLAVTAGKFFDIERHRVVGKYQVVVDPNLLSVNSRQVLDGFESSRNFEMEAIRGSTRESKR